MENKLNPYEILGVLKNAPDEEIKKAYKKLAVKHHPDRNPNKEEANKKFQELNTAYNTLIDPEKRQRYDQFGILHGENSASEGMPSGGFNPFDIFNNMFGGMQGFQQQNQADARRNAKSPDKILTVNLSLVDVYLGKLIPLDFVKMIKCEMCEGLGANSKDAIKSCNVCNGKGKIIRMMQMGPMIQQSIQPCNACNTTGKSIPAGCECSQCKGKKIVGIKRHLDCYVRPGSIPGTRISFKNEADWHADFGDVGDLVVHINCKNDEGVFRREADNLIMKKSISLLEALTEITFYFKHLDNRVIKVQHNEIIKPNQQMRIVGEGMPNLNDNLKKGDLIIYFDVIFPNSLEKDRAKYLVKILPSPKKQIWDTQLELTPEKDITIHKLEPVANTKAEEDYNNKQKQPDFHQDFNDNTDDENVFAKFGMGNVPPGNPIECATQ